MQLRNEAAGLAALADEAHLARALAEVWLVRDYLTTTLRALGFRALPSVANYLLVEDDNARDVRPKLLCRGICVRDCTAFGLPKYIRIGTRPVPDCQRPIAVMAETDD